MSERIFNATNLSECQKVFIDAAASLFIDEAGAIIIETSPEQPRMRHLNARLVTVSRLFAVANCRQREPRNFAGRESL